MVIEHSFVTTMDDAQAIRLASEFLLSRGFAAVAQGAFQIGNPQLAVIEMQRGKKSAGKAAGPIEMPQVVRVEFDRGRVIVAASVEARKRAFWTGTGRELPPLSPQAKPFSDMLMSVAQGLELILAQGRSVAEVTQACSFLDEQLLMQAGRSRRHRRVVFWSAIIFAVAMVTLLVIVIANL